LEHISEALEHFPDMPECLPAAAWLYCVGKR
jgi:hypothetical protein